jgi:exportin-1
MINQDFAEFPEHRVGFFKLLRAINLNCFPGMSVLVLQSQHIAHQISALLGLLPQQFKLFMDSIVWAIKHTMRDIAETGLNRTCCYSLDLRVPYLPCRSVLGDYQQLLLCGRSNSQPVLPAVLPQHLQDTFFVLTDADHKSGFKLQSLLLARMVQLVATDAIHAPLFDPAVVNDPNMTNAKFVRDYTANLLKSAFPSRV